MKLPSLFRPTGSSHAGFPDAPPPLRMPCASSPEDVARVEAQLAWVPAASPYREYLLGMLKTGGAL